MYPFMFDSSVFLTIRSQCYFGGVHLHVFGCGSGQVTAKFRSHHLEHDHDLAHFGLSRRQRQQVAGMLAAGLPFEDVLDKLQLSAGNARLSYLHLASRKDLHNIIREFGIVDNTMLHSNDADSVAAWVDRQTEGGTSMVRFVKYQHEDCMWDLRRDDFMLVLMSDVQSKALHTFSAQQHIVSLDSTHGTNEYNFLLTTLLVIDDHGEGFPAAFCYSNRVDECTMKVFLYFCREVLGHAVTSVVLMSDDTEVYFNAWCQIMGPPTNRLLCSWHVDRAFRRNLSKIKGGNILKGGVYKALRTIMELSDPTIFIQRLDQFIRQCKQDEAVADFGSYIEREYAGRPQLWAYCYRMGLGIHHNMHLEALHRVLKHVHLQGRKVKRLDKSIHALMKMMRFKLNDRLSKLHKGKWTRHLLAIRKRHAANLCMSASRVTVVDDGKFLVKGAQDEVYMVERRRSLPHPEPLCAQKCDDCQVCVHMYACNCLDGGLHMTICKHVHLVVRASTMNTTDCELVTSVEQWDQTEMTPHESSEQPNVMNEAESETDLILKSFTQQYPAGDLDKWKALAEKQWCEIHIMSDTADKAAAVCDQLSRVKTYLVALGNKPELPRLPPSSSREPANKKALHQRTFISTKKQHKRRADSSISKPSRAEKSILLDMLDGKVLDVHSSYANADHDYDCSSSHSM